MQISKIKISNILGIDELELVAGRYNEISGKNGRGKTSVLEAIKSATGAGHDATLLRRGAEEGEVVLVLDDGAEIRERVTAERTQRDVLQDGKKAKKSADIIKRLTDALSVNPVEFLAAPKKDRVKVLLEAMPLQLDFERLSQISGLKIAPSDEHALAILNMVRQTIYDDRTGTNRAAKEKAATINQIECAMPAAPAGVDGDEDELRAKLGATRDARDAELKRIDDKLSKLRAETAEARATLRADAQAKIDAIKAQLAADEQAQADKLSEMESRAAVVRQKALETYATAAQPLEVAVASIAANRDAAAKRKVTLETLESMRADLAELEQDVEKQTKALADIDAYKCELLAGLPIPNVEVRDGEIYRDGVPFDRLNTAQRVGIAVEIAKLRAGELRVVCLDGMELLDSESLAELERQTEAGGMQVFVTRVTENDFAVQSR